MKTKYNHKSKKSRICKAGTKKQIANIKRVCSRFGDSSEQCKKIKGRYC